ncbi:CPBP family intramembrane glutamic endopeptidase [Lysobacter korlensis]|uniref:CPBP family intramembrane glutamic endopeptidase n=1 Tax=Lysobacter korlensis TaxID=553636 RepID=A0ABV6RQW5_9GAMM
MEATALIPRKHVALVLLGFPAIATLISLLLLNKALLAWTGTDFNTSFWMLISAWYAVQVIAIAWIARLNGLSLAAFGLDIGSRRLRWMCIGYFVFALALVALIESAIATRGLDPMKIAQLSDYADLTPQSLSSRLVFVLMGFLAAVSEELVYRGFAINALTRRRIGRWAAVLIAAIPFVFQHGLKSLDQFWWFFGWALVFGALFVRTRNLYVNIAIHWLVILAALPAILQALR